MSATLDDYIKNVIGRGDEGSALLAMMSAPTLKNCKYVDVIQGGMNGIAVLKNLPMDHRVIVYSVSGDPNIWALDRYAHSMVERLVDISKKNGFTPLAFANVIDASSGNKDDILVMGQALRAAADTYKLAILNGELAILGDRVRVVANINGTMIALAPKSKLSDFTPFMIDSAWSPIRGASFDHEGKPVYINSDGIGTKTEFYERRGIDIELCLGDSLAMKLDDTIKLGATAKVVSDVVEWRKLFDKDNPSAYSRATFQDYADDFSEKHGIQYLLQFEESDKRIRGYKADAPSLNVSGSVVSIIDEERLKNPPIPREGDYLVSISKHPNPRSNGITDKRKLMIKLFGENYQETDEGKKFLEYLAAPSLVLYPYFKHMMDNGWIHSVYHMSGGAYNGKLARPLAKHRLFAELNHLSAPDERELMLAAVSSTPVDVAYAKWPMGNDGFVTVPHEHIGNVISYLSAMQMRWAITGQLKRGGKDAINFKNVHSYISENGWRKSIVNTLNGSMKKYLMRTGVELTAHNGQKVYYSGIDK